MTDVYDHPEYQAMLAGIRAVPDDDLRRLVLADWIEERGETERAELVRVQVEITRKEVQTAVKYDHFGLANLRVRERELWDENKYRWWGEREYIHYLGSEIVDAHGQYPESPKTFCSRGFISLVSGPLAALHGGEPCRRCHGDDGSHGGVDWMMDCPQCRGMGRTAGVLAQMLRREPVVVAGIEVTDREPWEPEELSNLPSWWRSSVWDDRGGAANATGNLPDDVFDMIGDMCPGERMIWSGPPSSQHLSFNTADAARLALSRALYRIHAPRGTA